MVKRLSKLVINKEIEDGMHKSVATQTDPFLSPSELRWGGTSDGAVFGSLWIALVDDKFASVAVKLVTRKWYLKTIQMIFWELEREHLLIAK